MKYPEEVKSDADERAIRRYRLYDFKCPKCGKLVEKLVEPDEVPRCYECECDMKQQLPLVNFNLGPVPFTGHFDETLNTFVRSNNHRKEVMREQGVTEHGGTPKPHGDAWV